MLITLRKEECLKPTFRAHFPNEKNHARVLVVKTARWLLEGKVFSLDFKFKGGVCFLSGKKKRKVRFISSAARIDDKKKNACRLTNTE